MSEEHEQQTERGDYTGDTSRIITGDAFEALDNLPETSAHAVVTDPPYGLAFMDRDWDRFSAEEYQDWCRQWAEKAHRVLKPGGHLLAFSSNRTHHRLFSGVENAGFEIRDTLTWHYGNGFPKDTDTQLKPATEFVALARRPFDGPAADCHDEHGTAYLNTDACRIEMHDGGGNGNWSSATEESDGGEYEDKGRAGGDKREMDERGRYPANLVLDGRTADRLDDQSGELHSGELDFSKHEDRDNQTCYGEFSNGSGRSGTYGGDSGGASRFYYCAKATQAERTLNGRIDNPHPTVKPLELMEWLVTLASQEGQTVVDPFCGTGTTCKAAKELNREWLGIEQDAKWADVARVRCGLSPSDPSHVRGDGGQSGLEEFVSRTDDDNRELVDTAAEQGGDSGSDA